VLGPADGVFAITVLVTPLVSQPGKPAYMGQGVYSSTPLDVVLQDETIFSDQQTSLDIRLSLFPVPPPDRGDQIEITQPEHPAFGSLYWVGDSDLDGQGGAKLLLRTQQDPPS